MRIITELNKLLPLKINGWNESPFIIIFHSHYTGCIEAYKAFKESRDDIALAGDLRVDLEDKTRVEFRNYSQDICCIEGINPDLVLFASDPPNELWNTLMFRVHGPEGKMIVID